MTEELLYTSAPRGLKPGSSGFCTVISTNGMSAPLAQSLESLSGYRHLYPPGDVQAHLNPVACSHLQLSAGGKKYSVLSRVADYGLDYSQRSNKLAHHVVVEPQERPMAGPAWLLSQSGFMETAWDGELRILPQGRPVPRGDLAPASCRTWEKTTGDAGWAGVLAQSWMDNPDRLAFIRFDPRMPMLALISEALALIPPERRWQVTFSTYATTLPQNVSCLWRCVLNGSKEANEARRFVRDLQLNLCQPMGRAPDNLATEAARRGHLLPALLELADQDSVDDLQDDKVEPVIVHPAPFIVAIPVMMPIPSPTESGYRLQPGQLATDPSSAHMPPPVPKQKSNRKQRTWKATLITLCSLVTAVSIYLVIPSGSSVQNEPIENLPSSVASDPQIDSPPSEVQPALVVTDNETMPQPEAVAEAAIAAASIPAPNSPSEKPAEPNATKTAEKQADAPGHTASSPPHDDQDLKPVRINGIKDGRYPIPIEIANSPDLQMLPFSKTPEQSSELAAWINTFHKPAKLIELQKDSGFRIEKMGRISTTLSNGEHFLNVSDIKDSDYSPIQWSALDVSTGDSHVLFIFHTVKDYPSTPFGRALWELSVPAPRDVQLVVGKCEVLLEDGATRYTFTPVDTGKPSIIQYEGHDVPELRLRVKNDQRQVSLELDSGSQRILEDEQDKHRSTWSDRYRTVIREVIPDMSRYEKLRNSELSESGIRSFFTQNIPPITGDDLSPAIEMIKSKVKEVVGKIPASSLPEKLREEFGNKATTILCELYPDFHRLEHSQKQHSQYLQVVGAFKRAKVSELSVGYYISVRDTDMYVEVLKVSETVRK